MTGNGFWGDSAGWRIPDQLIPAETEGLALGPRPLRVRSRLVLRVTGGRVSVTGGTLTRKIKNERTRRIGEIDLAGR